MRRLFARRPKEAGSNGLSTITSTPSPTPPTRKTFPSGIQLLHDAEDSVVE